MKLHWVCTRTKLYSVLSAASTHDYDSCMLISNVSVWEAPALTNCLFQSCWGEPSKPEIQHETPALSTQLGDSAGILSGMMSVTRTHIKQYTPNFQLDSLPPVIFYLHNLFLSSFPYILKISPSRTIMIIHCALFIMSCRRNLKKKKII